MVSIRRRSNWHWQDRTRTGRHDLGGVRGDAAGERLEVKRVTSGETVTVVWQAGDNTVAWPDMLPLLADEMYLLRLGDQLRLTNLLVREVPAAVSDGGVVIVAFLAAKGCLSQARKELERLREKQQRSAS